MAQLAVFPHLDDGTLLLRLGTSTDCDAIARYYSDNREMLKPFEPIRPENFFTPAYWEMRLAMNFQQFERRQSAGLFIFEPDNKTVIGSANLSNIVGYPLHGAFLGYSLAHTQWGKGRMKRALSLMLPWAFEYFNLHRIAANYLPDNERSGRLLASLGFEQEGYAKDYLMINGVWRDHILTSLTRRNWISNDLNSPWIAGGKGRA